MKVGTSDCAGVNETSGGAGFACAAAVNELGALDVREDKLDCVWIVYEGRRASLAAVTPTTAVWFPMAVLVDAAETAEDRGADRVFFILEKMEVTRV